MSNIAKKNIAVLVSGGGTNLQKIIDAKKAGEIKNGEIRLVVSSNDKAYALTRARENDIEAIVISKKSFADANGVVDEESFTAALIEAMESRGIDLIVLGGYLSILAPAFAASFKNRIINVHPALIPSFCGKGFYGMHVHEAVIKSGVKLTGATVHFANEVCDGGPIISQRAIEVLNDDTPESLQKRVMEECEWQLLPQAVALFCNDKIKVVGNKTVIT